MFDIVNERYQRALADAEDEKFIMEDVTGNPVDVMDPDEAAGEASAENEVDVYSVPKKDLDKMDKLAEKLVSASDYDDEDLDELIDDGYSDEVIVAEATVTTPGYDPVGSYNDGIKSGTVDYDMNDCEDRGGVGVNSVIARNNQLSETVFVDSTVLMESIDMLLEDAEAAETEGKTEEKTGMIKKAGKAIKSAINYILEKLRALGRLIARAFIAAGRGLKNAMDKVIAKFDARELGVVRIVKGIYDQKVLNDISRKASDISKRANMVRTDYKSDSDYGMEDTIKAISINMDRAVVPFNEANKMIANFNTSQAKKYDSIINSLAKTAQMLSKAADRADDKGRTKMINASVKAINSVIADLNKVTSAHQRNMNAAAEATKKYAKNADKLGEQMAKGRDKASKTDYKKDAKQAAAEADARNAKAQKEADEFTANREKFEKQQEKKQARADKKAAAAEARKKRAEERNAKKNQGNAQGEAMNDTVGYFDESTDMYWFDFELDEAVGSDTDTTEPKDCPKGKADTYDEFKEDAKDSGVRDVKPLDTPKKPTSDLSDRDPKQPGLGNEVAMAKNNIAKAYTAEQLQNIPATKLPAVRKAVTDILATKSEAIRTLKEAYDAHIGDSFEVRAAILEDASRARIEADNLTHTLSILDSMMDNIDNEAARIFNEDSEADLSDLDLGDDDAKDDEKKDSKKEDKKSDSKDKDDKKDSKSKKDDEECEDGECDDKDEKKSKKDDEECDDEECKDKDKKDDKKSDKSDDEKDDDEDKDDADEADDDSLDESTLLAEIDALLSDLDA